MSTIEIYFGTNRNPISGDPSYGSGLNERGEPLRFGKAQVAGDLSKVVKVETKKEDLRKKPQRLGSEVIFKEIRKKMVKDNDTVVFIHGFNRTFSEALIDAARMKQKYDTEEQSYTFFVFTWPSDDVLLPFIAYFNNRHDASVSGGALGRGLLKLGAFVQHLPEKQRCPGHLHLIAHSMGVYALRHAVQAIRREMGDNNLPRLFDEVLLLAAEEDDDAFEHVHKLALLPKLTHRVSVYHNSGDIPLVVGDLTKGNPDRLGSDGPRRSSDLPAKVSVVDCSKVVTGSKEHAYHETEQLVIDDIRAVLQGQCSDEIANRHYVHEMNSYRIKKPPSPTAPTTPSSKRPLRPRG